MLESVSMVAVSEFGARSNFGSVVLRRQHKKHVGFVLDFCC